jgi:hypothetical protein
LFNKKNIDISTYDTVFCDSLQALEWAYDNGLPKSAIIKSNAPAVLWDKGENIHNVENRWTIDELEKFQSTIKNMTENIFDVTKGITGVERELALTISRYAYQFQKVIYKAACLEEADFNNPRLFIYVDGKTGPAGNMMNSIWDQLLLCNPSFLMVRYTLKNDEWNILTTHGVSYWRRFKVAGYETIIYRLAIKLMKKLPNWMFSKEILMPNENELNIEIAHSLALRGVKVSHIQPDYLSSVDIILDENNAALYAEIEPIMRKRVEEWVVPSAVETTMLLFKSNLEKRIKKFKSLAFAWEKVISNSINMRRAVLMNATGNINGHALSYVCRKNNISLISSQHGVTIEISEAHKILQVSLDNSTADVMFSYNSKIIDIEKNTFFNNSKHYMVGMPWRLIRMKHSKVINKSATSIVYISTNIYHMGLCLSSKTDYGRAIDESKIITNVLGKLPHKVRYKTYPEDNRRYADIDPVLSIIDSANNIELFRKKIDMRYLVFEHRIFVTTCATSTLSWPVMSGKPVVFINQKNNNPLTNKAHASLSKGIFVFDDDDKNFHQNLREFLSQSLEEIERLWEEKEGAREEMIKEYFTAYSSGSGVRAAKIIIQEYL